MCQRFLPHLRKASVIICFEWIFHKTFIYLAFSEGMSICVRNFPMGGKVQPTDKGCSEDSQNNSNYRYPKQFSWQ